MSKTELNRRTFLQYGGTSVAAGAALFGSGAAASAAASSQKPSSGKKEKVSCNVAIVGGGAAGLHTAYRLAQLPRTNPNSDVCLFEKADRLGGRIYDVALDPTHPDLVVGLGALRVMETQEYVFALAEELGIQMQAAPWRDDLLSARGFTAHDSDQINELAYPLVTKEHISGGGFDTETAFYDQLRFGPERANVDAYPDFRSYARAVLGTQGYHFLSDVFRFRADFLAPVDARGYLDYLDEEWDVCCTPYYPVGGMSRFIQGLAQGAAAGGVQIGLSEPTISITRQKGDHPYLIQTSRRAVSARKLVIAADPGGLSHVTGDVADALTSQAQFQDLLGIPVVTITQQWPYAWWEGASGDGKDIHRAWTTEHAMNAMEIPLAPYAADQLVTRTVYDDDVRTVSFWEQTARRGTSAVEAEIMRGLTYLFPGVTIPAPRATVVQTWPAGWYWLRGGSSFTNAAIADWAVSPLGKEPVSLVGEAYNPQRSGWSDAAYKSSINTLNARFGTHIVVPTAMAARTQHGHRSHARA